MVIYYYHSKMENFISRGTRIVNAWRSKGTRVEREEYPVRSGQRGAATDCKPPCGEGGERAPGSERDADALRFGTVTGPLSEKQEWNRGRHRLLTLGVGRCFFYAVFRPLWGGAGIACYGIC